jgi:hypothetical protein
MAYGILNMAYGILNREAGGYFIACLFALYETLSRWRRYRARVLI